MKMPCKKCGSLRILAPEKIMCPKCDKIKVQNSQNTIDSRKTELDALITSFKNELKQTNYNQTFGSAIINRELAAKAVIYSPNNRKHAVTEWLVYTFILKNLKYLKKNGGSNFLKIADRSRKIIPIFNEITCLEKGFSLIIQKDNQEVLLFTEKEPLSFVPEAAYSDAENSFSKTAFFGDGKHGDVAILQEGLMAPIQKLLLSEEISRVLKRLYHSRLLSFIKNANDAAKFVDISFKLAEEGLVLNTENGVDIKYHGLQIFYENDLKKIKTSLSKLFLPKDVDWYFDNLLNQPNNNMFDFFDSIFVKDTEKNTITFPLYSLLLLGYATKKWSDDPDVGRAFNFKGETVEDFFFRFLSGYNVCVEHPTTHEKLVRVNHPEKPIEIADIMGYNDENVIVLESKFWNIPILSDLEEEIEKFEKKIEYISDNLEKFNLKKDLNVVPIFYTPYAPYKAQNNIMILPTILSVGTKIAATFGLKKIEFLKELPDFDGLFEKIKYPAPFRIDVSTFLKAVPENKFGISDVVVWKYDKEELTVLIDSPISIGAGLVYLDINKEIYEKMKKEKIVQGDIIRVITADLNGAWSLIQLIDFKKIVDKKDWVSNLEQNLTYNRMLSLFNYMKNKK